jgi:type IV pilus assembly protein PilE
MKMKKQQFGFTLIELMIAVAIVGIISAIAYPSYKDSVTRSKRTDAKVSLTTLAGNFERCFTMNGQYTATATPAKACAYSTTGANTVNSSYTASDKNYYTLAGTITATTFSLTATPNGWTEGNCNVYTLTNTGVKQASGSWGNSRCWND